MKLKIAKHSAAYWRVTLDHPPLNLLDTEMIDGLVALVEELERDAEVKIVVVDSANPDYFMAHLDIVDAAANTPKVGASGLPIWVELGLRLERASFITVGVVRGRARGVGSEILQMLDIRFASRERAILSQIEVGCGLFPGGGGLERLPRLIGRSRAMEVIVGADDYDADTAERYGWVNRSIPDADLDAFVERFAARVVSFDRNAICSAKDIINERSGGLVKGEDQTATQSRFFEILSTQQATARVSDLFKKGLQQPSELELRLGELLGA
jgi:enoyl-CoA hydratase/carnithine racemase